MSITVYSKEQDEKNNKGIWKEYEGSRLRIARWLNVNFISGYLAESKEALPELIDGDEDVSEELVVNKIDSMARYNLMCKAMAGTILTDWEGVKNEATNEDVEFTPELAEILLRNNIQVHNFVKNISQELENFEGKKEENVSGEQ